MKKPKMKAGILGAVAGTVLKDGAGIVLKEVSRKQKIREEQEKEIKLYNDKKHHGFIKISSVLLTLISTLLTVFAFKNKMMISGFLGIILIILFGYVYLLCLEIFKEKMMNIYKIIFAIGCVLLIFSVSLISL